MNKLILLKCCAILINISCKPLELDKSVLDNNECNLDFIYKNQKGCDGQIYPDPNYSPYILPFPAGLKYKTGLTNCSSSYHGESYPDRYAYDFDMPIDTRFIACRDGVVVFIENNASSNGGGAGNEVVIDHLDQTFGVYLHSPKNGISVILGDTIKQGDTLGKTGKSGLAGYPHLHFIVVQNDYKWPYDPIPITFGNVYPSDVVLKSHKEYNACEN